MAQFFLWKSNFHQRSCYVIEEWGRIIVVLVLRKGWVQVAMNNPSKEMRMCIRSPQMVGQSDHMQPQLLFSMCVEYLGNSFMEKWSFIPTEFWQILKKFLCCFPCVIEIVQNGQQLEQEKDYHFKADRMTAKRKDKREPHQVPSLCLFFELQVIITDSNGSRWKTSHIGFYLTIKLTAISQSPQRDSESINIPQWTQSSVG